MFGYDYRQFDQFIADALDHYEKTAPTVCDYLNDLYSRVWDNADNVRLSELITVSHLQEEGTWEHPNYAANRIYHLMNRLKMDTTGQAGF